MLSCESSEITSVEKENLVVQQHISNEQKQVELHDPFEEAEILLDWIEEIRRMERNELFSLANEEIVKRSNPLIRFAENK